MNDICKKLLQAYLMTSYLYYSWFWGLKIERIEQEQRE